MPRHNAHGYRPRPNPSLWLSAPGSARHFEPTRPQIAPVRTGWFPGGIGNNLCGFARLDRNAQASVERGNESKDVHHHGNLSDTLGLLRPVDSFTTGNPVECSCSVDQFPERRSLRSFCSQNPEHSEQVSRKGEWS